MQLIPEGPNIPEALLNAHADGEVVFFCGAGVSVDAGYPLFSGLVSKLQEQNPLSDSPELSSAIAAQQFDFALSIMERKIGAESRLLRRGVRDILSATPRTLKTHETLLDLASQGRHQFRIVTTNFDRLFVDASKAFGTVLPDAAPRLPIPKKSRWNSIVHLHGLLSDQPNDESGLFDLVLTAADFGEAYITDSYCSRFIVELLRNFTVVFVGYSLNDPVMRYLLDAISVAQSRDEAKFIRPYAFISHKPGRRDDVLRAWEHRHVEVVPYLTKQKHKHFRLYDSLKSWTALGKGGQRARETLALNEAQKPFVAEDNFTRARLLWALNDQNGKAAEALADSKDQTAPIDWLSIFAEHGLLDRIYSPSEWREELAKDQRSQNKNPEPIGYQGSVTYGDTATRLKPVTQNLLRWMQTHLDKLELADWFLQHGGIPHPTFCALYRNPRTSNRDKLDRERQLFWDLLTSESYRKSAQLPSLRYSLKEDFDLTKEIDLKELCVHLALRLEIKPSIYRKFDREHESERTFFSEFQFELKLVNDDFGYALSQIVQKGLTIEGLYRLADPLTEIVAGAMDWLKIVGKASKEQDGTGYSVPSISPHDQNEHADDFAQVVFLLRNSFDQMSGVDADRATALARRWAEKEYPIFRRFFLYAASVLGTHLDGAVLSLLTAPDGHQLLWERDAQRELKKYLRERVQHWQPEQVATLAEKVLTGPDRVRYAHIEDDDAWEDIRDRVKLSLLKKLAQGNVNLPDQASQELDRLDEKYPSTQPADHSDEFLIFSGGVRSVTWDEDVRPKDFQLFCDQSPAGRLEHWDSDRDPKQFRKLTIEQIDSGIATMEEAIRLEFTDEGFWREGFYGLATALKPIASDAEDEAFTSHAERLTRVVDVLIRLPGNVISTKPIAYAIAQFWRDTAGTLQTDQYLRAWDKIWVAVAAQSDEQPDDPVGFAINDPGGQLMEDLLIRLWPKDAKVGGLLPEALAQRLSQAIGRIDRAKMDASTIIIASRINILYAVDPKWTVRNGLSLLSWEGNVQAAAYWSAFLWGARASPDLISEIKSDFIKAFEQYDALSDGSYRVLCQLLVLASLEMNALSSDVTKQLLGQLPQAALHHVSAFVSRRVQNSKENSSTFWSVTVKPWLTKVWPREQSKRTIETAKDFAMTALHCGPNFPDAMRWFERHALLQAIPQASTILYALDDNRGEVHEDFTVTTALVEQFPKDVLDFLFITRPFQWDHGKGRAVLDRIAQASPELANTPEYAELESLLP